MIFGRSEAGSAPELREFGARVAGRFAGVYTWGLSVIESSFCLPVIAYLFVCREVLMFTLPHRRVLCVLAFVLARAGCQSAAIGEALSAKEVVFAVGDVKVEAALAEPMAAVTHLGYMTDTGVRLFSEIELD